MIEKFKEQAQCMIDQYGNYTIDPVGIHVSMIIECRNLKYKLSV